MKLNHAKGVHHESTNLGFHLQYRDRLILMMLLPMKKALGTEEFYKAVALCGGITDFATLFPYGVFQISCTVLPGTLSSAVAENWSK